MGDQCAPGYQGGLYNGIQRICLVLLINDTEYMVKK